MLDMHEVRTAISMMTEVVITLATGNPDMTTIEMLQGFLSYLDIQCAKIIGTQLITDSRHAQLTYPGLNSYWADIDKCILLS